MNKKILELSSLSLFIALLSGCSATNKESVKVDPITTKKIEISSKIQKPLKAVIKSEPVVILKPVVKSKPLVKKKLVLSKVEYIDPRDALDKRRLELAKQRLDKEKSYKQQRQ